MSTTTPPAAAPTPVALAELTTLRLGGPAPELRIAASVDDVVAGVREAVRSDSGLLVLGGGSNLVIADAGVPDPVLRVAVPGVHVVPDAGSADAVVATVGAGVDWDAAVAELVDAGYGELAPLSGIPGSTGATPVQNVGAYGTEVSDVLVAVQVVDRATGEVGRLTADELRLAYRSSVLRGTDRAVVTAVEFRLTTRPVTVRYAELARTLGVPVGGTAPAAAVREAVLGLRRGKGMVLDPEDKDTWSVGSFFTNPLLTTEQAAVAGDAVRVRLGAETVWPAYPAEDGRVKWSAAWLIERAGFAKGHPGPGGRVSLSTKHTLALTNRGDGTTEDLVALAREIRDGVRDAFTVTLEPEPVFVGVRL
ncbi:UDP-N-acetylmuramate dehydrogenase [Nakamurella flava]|uniref:UDP-N-acetylenolpyruvoylglucosamine reductase n=1 Tax=Nakamurella flava TaxID=2576308 RepID=A0A4U6QGF4_9ACTN|nr:UDP-N-acetylmuramate dehydrogenase [Nakamurella flava]TKV59231.1 UDP-N-acetylmuramate dehydrogenase [Nakamurella flava]